ncbi:MAG TPA: SEC-C metal-binding domain-containing protein [Bryobacteraceae bacterium]|nr:SEC-C metal-binding domain-containing protein [Bryobacteraceae bacterium]
MQRAEQAPEPGERPEHEWNYQEEKQLAIDAAKEEDRRAEALAAQNSVLDFTRKSQRRRERELTVLQFIGDGFTALQAQPVIAGSKAGRNDICTCGSGKKYKKCHGA